MGDEAQMTDLCPGCLWEGRQVVGEKDDFARRCKKHIIPELPNVLYISPDVMAAYLKFVPRKSVIVDDLSTPEDK